MIRRLLIAVLIGEMATPRVQADDHLVAPRQVGEALADAALRRGSDLARLDRLLSTPEAEQGRGVLRVSLARAALPSLTDSELRDLSVRIEALEADPVAGDVAAVGGGLIIAAFAILLVVSLLRFTWGPVE
jgi:hypothetical protein